MTITVDIRPEVQAELAQQAAARGRAIEAYAASLLEEAVRLPAASNRPAFDKDVRKPRGRASGVAQRVYARGLTIRELIAEGRP